MSAMATSEKPVLIVGISAWLQVTQGKNKW